MKVQIPIPCPKCGGKLQAITHEGVVIKLLKTRCWHICTECDYEQDTEKFKNNLCTV